MDSDGEEFALVMDVEGEEEAEIDVEEMADDEEDEDVKVDPGPGRMESELEDVGGGLEEGEEDNGAEEGDVEGEEEDGGEGLCNGFAGAATSTVSSSSSGSGSSGGEGGRKFRSSMWQEYCTTLENVGWVAPVHFFKHVPFAGNWLDFAKLGLVVEVPNPISIRENLDNLKCWFGEIIGFAGYRALVRFLHMKDDDESVEHKHSWVSFCSDIPRHIGFSSGLGIPLAPVIEDMSIVDQAAISEKQVRLKSKATLAPNHYEMVCTEIGSKARRFAVGRIIEAVDRTDCSRYRLAQVLCGVGDRIQVLYCDLADTDDAGFWFNQHSSHVQPLGFSNTIGVSVYGCRLKRQNFPMVDLSLLPKKPHGLKIKGGMLFEIRHPVIPHKIVPGYVVRPLTHGYFVAGTDWTRSEELVETILHVTSDYVLPLNFCRNHEIRMEPPANGVSKNHGFSWKRYLTKNNASALDLSAIQRPDNPFTKGCKLEAVNVINPTHIRPATVVTIAGHLMRIHFDGKSRNDPEAFQWVSCESLDIYPVGYAEMVGQKTRGYPDKPRLCDTIQKPSSSSGKQ